MLINSKYSFTGRQIDTRLTATFQDNLGNLISESLDQSGFWWSERQWGGSGISWTICKSFAPRSRQMTTPAPQHLIFYMPERCSPGCKTNSIKALKTKSKHWRRNYFTRRLITKFVTNSSLKIPVASRRKMLPGRISGIFWLEFTAPS